jgi:hypothetical protein
MYSAGFSSSDFIDPSVTVLAVICVRKHELIVRIPVRATPVSGALSSVPRARHGLNSEFAGWQFPETADVGGSLSHGPEPVDNLY